MFLLQSNIWEKENSTAKTGLLATDGSSDPISYTQQMSDLQSADCLSHISQDVELYSFYARSFSEIWGTQNIESPNQEIIDFNSRQITQKQQELSQKDRTIQRSFSLAKPLAPELVLQQYKPLFRHETVRVLINKILYMKIHSHFDIKWFDYPQRGGALQGENNVIHKLDIKYSKSIHCHYDDQCFSAPIGKYSNMFTVENLGANLSNQCGLFALLAVLSFINRHFEQLLLQHTFQAVVETTEQQVAMIIATLQQLNILINCVGYPEIIEKFSWKHTTPGVVQQGDIQTIRLCLENCIEDLHNGKGIRFDQLRNLTILAGCPYFTNDTILNEPNTISEYYQQSGLQWHYASGPLGHYRLFFPQLVYLQITDTNIQVALPISNKDTEIASAFGCGYDTMTAEYNASELKYIQQGRGTLKYVSVENVLTRPECMCGVQPVHSYVTYRLTLRTDKPQVIYQAIYDQLNKLPNGTPKREEEKTVKELVVSRGDQKLQFVYKPPIELKTFFNFYDPEYNHNELPYPGGPIEYLLAFNPNVRVEFQFPHTPYLFKDYRVNLLDINGWHYELTSTEGQHLRLNCLTNSQPHIPTWAIQVDTPNHKYICWFRVVTHTGDRITIIDTLTTRIKNLMNKNPNQFLNPSNIPLNIQNTVAYAQAQIPGFPCDLDQGYKLVGSCYTQVLPECLKLATIVSGPRLYQLLQHIGLNLPPLASYDHYCTMQVPELQVTYNPTSLQELIKWKTHSNQLLLNAISVSSPSLQEYDQIRLQIAERIYYQKPLSSFLYNLNKYIQLPYKLLKHAGVTILGSYAIYKSLNFQFGVKRTLMKLVISVPLKLMTLVYKKMTWKSYCTLGLALSYYIYQCSQPIYFEANNQVHELKVPLVAKYDNGFTESNAPKIISSIQTKALTVVPQWYLQQFPITHPMFNIKQYNWIEEDTSLNTTVDRFKEVHTITTQKIKSIWNILNQYIQPKGFTMSYSTLGGNHTIIKPYMNVRYYRGGTIPPLEHLQKIIDQKTQQAKVKYQHVRSEPLASLSVKYPYDISRIQETPIFSQVQYYTREQTPISLQQFKEYIQAHSNATETTRKIQLPGIPYDDNDIARMEGHKLNFKAQPLFANHDSLNHWMSLMARHQNHMVYPDQSYYAKLMKASEKWRHQLLREWSAQIDLIEPISMEAYISHFPSSKKKLYARIAKKWFYTTQEGQEISSRLTANFKKNEPNFTDPSKVRGRIIWNPSDEIKLLGGYLNYHLIESLKQIAPWFMHGKDTAQMAEIMQQEIQQIGDGIGIWWDGSQHDSSQTAQYMKDIDEYYLSKLIPQLGYKLGMPHGTMDKILKQLISTSFKFIVYYDLKEHGDKMMTGTINGTVLSGHPTKTTLMNSIRVANMIVGFMALQGYTYKKDYIFFVQGDDTWIFGKPYILNTFRDEFYRCFSQSPHPHIHGFGYIIKEFGISRDKIEFLSKIGQITPDGVKMSRNPIRMIKGGNVTMNINKNISLDDYNIGIIGQLKHQNHSIDLVNDYLKKREALIKKNYTKEYQDRLASELDTNQYNSHNCNVLPYWWDSYPAYALGSKNPWLEQYEPTSWFYSMLDDVVPKIEDTDLMEVMK